jgi:hypothetical protein
MSDKVGRDVKQCGYCKRWYIYPCNEKKSKVCPNITWKKKKEKR